MGKNKCPECPSIPGWVVTFGDLMSLLLTFFILLLSFSSVQESEFNKAKGSILGALGLLAPQAGTSYVPAPEMQPGVAESESDYEIMLEDIEDELSAVLEEESQLSDVDSLRDIIDLEITDKGVHIVINDSIFFAPGSDILTKNFQAILSGVGKVIAQSSGRYNIVVEGHTDNTPINTAKFPSNWELSSFRALNVIKFMIAKFDIPPEICSASGYGEYRPVADNKTAEGRNKNRRVEIFIVEKK